MPHTVVREVWEGCLIPWWEGERFAVCGLRFAGCMGRWGEVWGRGNVLSPRFAVWGRYNQKGRQDSKVFLCFPHVSCKPE